MDQTEIGATIHNYDQQIAAAEARAQQCRVDSAEAESQSTALNEEIATLRRQLEAMEVASEVEDRALGREHGALLARISSLVADEAVFYRTSTIKRLASQEHQRQARDLNTELGQLIRDQLPGAYTAKAKDTGRALRLALADHCIVTAKASSLPTAAIDLGKLAIKSVNGGLSAELNERRPVWVEALGR